MKTLYDRFIEKHQEYEKKPDDFKLKNLLGMINGNSAFGLALPNNWAKVTDRPCNCPGKNFDHFDKARLLDKSKKIVAKALEIAKRPEGTEMNEVVENQSSRAYYAK